jgi:hypothetical protein
MEVAHEIYELAKRVWPKARILSFHVPPPLTTIPYDEAHEEAYQIVVGAGLAMLLDSVRRVV